ncbi:Twinkle protein, mitochondrial [Strongyloides ratti]|uniref:Twinkle protein, mitochondrial n=1 Tax=Strongyloides ratti TaxID=34506 RepID=A0A090KXF1_STRRB|nr:Twinkle protein, mitochondrial [Strongyloides ratti]CEF62175.1 Twinkle protein, mitochondrial [Strongyloides ratti]
MNLYQSNFNSLFKTIKLTQKSYTSISKLSDVINKDKFQYLDHDFLTTEENDNLTELTYTGSNSLAITNLTPTDIKNDLMVYKIPTKNSKYTNFTTTICTICLSSFSNYIIPEANLTHCYECGAEGTYENFLKQLEVKKNVFEELAKYQNPEIMITDDQLDSDLYDNISFNNFLKEYEENDRKIELIKQSHIEKMNSSKEKNITDKQDFDMIFPSIKEYYTDSNILKIWNESHEIPDDLDYNVNVEFKLFNKFLGIDRLSPSLLKKCNVRMHINGNNELALVYPRYKNLENSSNPIGIKIIRQTNNSKLTKENYPLDENKYSGFFCHHLMKLDEKSVILTTNERDAMAINEAKCVITALSLPKGHKLDYSIIPYLEKYEMIYLWFPKKQQRYAKDLAILLNIERCIIILEENRPIELLRYGRMNDITNIILNILKKPRINSLTSLKELRNDVKMELVDNSEKIKGFSNWIRFDILNDYLGGLRPSELTVVTGGSGYGKTTFICEYAIDLFTQGVRTLICSFEMNEEKIMKWMVVQYASVPLYRKEYHSKIDIWLDRFEKGQPSLMFLKTNTLRNKNITDIFNILKENIIQCGIQHIVIDNLQFLIGLSTLNNHKATSIDKFNLQDQFIGLLRNLATDCGVHVTLVVHPRKMSGDANVELQDVGGSGKVTQEADNVLAIIRKEHPTDPKIVKKFLVILKNRYGGRRTSFEQLEMVYQTSTYTHVIIDHSKIDVYDNNEDI